MCCYLGIELNTNKIHFKNQHISRFLEHLNFLFSGPNSFTPCRPTISILDNRQPCNSVIYIFIGQIDQYELYNVQINIKNYGALSFRHWSTFLHKKTTITRILE